MICISCDVNLVFFKFSFNKILARLCARVNCIVIYIIYTSPTFAPKMQYCKSCVLKELTYLSENQTQYNDLYVLVHRPTLPPPIRA